MAQKEKFNVYDHVTQTILAQLEAGTVPWRKPWTGGGGGIPIPLRHEGTPYQGINVLLLWCRAMQQPALSEDGAQRMLSGGSSYLEAFLVAASADSV